MATTLESAGPAKLAVPPLAQSPADVFSQTGGQPDGSDRPQAAPADFGKALGDAQRADRAGQPAAPEPAQKAAAPAQTQAATPAEPKPTVPKLPDPPAKPTKAADWDALKAKHAEELAAIKAERDNYQRDLAAAKAAGDSEEVKRLRDEHKQYKELLRDVAIERDPEFKARYQTKSQAAIEAATQAAGDNGEKLAKLLALPSTPWRDEQIDKLTEGLSASSKRRVEAALVTLEQVDVARQAEIAERRATFEAKQSELTSTQQQREAAQRAQLDGVFDKVKSEWTEKHPFFAPREGDDQHNQQVQQSLALAKEIFNGQMSPEDLVAASFWAASGPVVLDGWMKERAAREAAEKQLDRLRGVQPGGERADSPKGEEAAQAAPTGNFATDLRSFNRGLKEAQGRDAQTRVGGRR